MKASIVNIGDELLIGQVVNTNAAWMGEMLTMNGIAVEEVVMISDTRAAIAGALDRLLQSSDLVMLTGGLGPTKDDVTKHALADYFDVSLVLDERVLADVRLFFEKRGMPLSDLNRGQAEVPAGCEVIRNPHGTAPGMLFRKQYEGRPVVVVSMPGVPYETQPMVAEVMQQLIAHQGVCNGGYLTRTLLTTGIGESFLADKLAEWEAALPVGVKLAYLPSPGMVRLRIGVSRSGSAPVATLERLTQELRALTKEYCFGYDQESMEMLLGALLAERGETLAVAESCTGGYLAHLITTIPGSSTYFKGGVVSYHNETKMRMLSVAAGDIDKHGAVSEPVVRQMAAAVKHLMTADYGLATSGIAGPDGGTSEKPVGLVWIALAGPEGVVSGKFMFGQNRLRNIHATAMAAMNMLRKQLTDH